MSSRIVLYELESECCGCSACTAICPKNAITMQENGEGFLYPVIDEAACIACGLCQKVCPLKKLTEKSNQMRVGILCLSDKKNFGAKIVAWALQEKVRALLPDSAEVGLIEYQGQEERHFLEDFSLNPAKLFASGKRFLNERSKAKTGALLEKRRSAADTEKREAAFSAFNDTYLNTFGRAKRTLEFKTIADTLDAVIIGSDIVFRPEFAEKFSDVYLLGCLKNSVRDIKKISYAAAIASDSKKILNPLKPYYGAGMENFDSISVREKSSQAFLQALTNKKVHYCCDPVLLYRAEDFAFVPPISGGGYIYANILDKTAGFDEFVLNLSRKTGREILFYSNAHFLDGTEVKDVYADGPLEFIDRVRSAEYVVTNSFHSVVFSLLFHKKFAVLVRADQSLKLKDLLTTLGLEDRIVSNPKRFDIEREIDWAAVDKKLEAWRAESLAFLKEAL